MLAIAPKPLILPRIDRDEAERSRRLNAYRGPLVLPGAKGFSLVLVQDHDMEIDPAELVEIEATLGGAPFIMTGPANLVHELVQALGPTITLEGMAPDLGGLLLEAAIATLLGALENATGLPVMVTAFKPLTRAPHGTPLLLQGPDRAWPLHLAGDETVLDTLLGPWPSGERDMDWLPARATLRLGLTTLPIPVLQSLRTDDVVLLQTHPQQASTAMLVVAEAFTAPVALGETAVQVLEATSHDRSWTMSGFKPDEEAGDISDLPIRLSFDLGHLDVPMQELRRLDAGMVLELGRKAQEFVDISANGRKIGRGELVEVDGMVGVRIARIFTQG